jgi:two-component system, cell cycle response regulator DivK
MSGKNEEAPLVLVVDDYLDAREMCAEFLRFSGYRVEEAVDGFEAIEKATDLLPAVILMDLSLPRLDGWEATRRLKKDDRTKAIPIIALTGHALAGHAEVASEAGCDSFLTKPCLPDVMVAEVKRVLAAGAERAKEKSSTTPRSANRRSKR